MAFKFESLRVWQMASDLCTIIADLRKKFPSEERFVLSPQIQRAADSVALNIAEGSTGQSNPEFKRFLGISLRSAIEVVACLILAKKRMLLEEETFRKIYEDYTNLIKSIQQLRNSI